MFNDVADFQPGRMHRLPYRGRCLSSKTSDLKLHPDPMELSFSSASTLAYSVSAKTALQHGTRRAGYHAMHPAALPLGTARQPRRYRVEPSACKLGFAIPLRDNRSISGHGVLQMLLGWRASICCDLYDGPAS